MLESRSATELSDGVVDTGPLATRELNREGVGTLLQRRRFLHADRQPLVALSTVALVPAGPVILGPPVKFRPVIVSTTVRP